MYANQSSSRVICGTMVAESVNGSVIILTEVAK